MRINITGNAGAGKTTLAQQLGGTLELPVLSLDSIVWKPGWRKTQPEERRLLEQDLINKPSWIIDGVSSHVRRASDLVVFLDIPRRVCMWRGIKRSIHYFNRTRPDLPTNCPEWRILPRLLHIIWRFPSRGGMAIRKEAMHTPNQYYVVVETNARDFLIEEISSRFVAFKKQS